MDDLNRNINNPANPNNIHNPRTGGNGPVYVVLGALVVVIGLMAFAFSGGDSTEDGRAATDAPMTEQAPLGDGPLPGPADNAPPPMDPAPAPTPGPAN